MLNKNFNIYHSYVQLYTDVITAKKDLTINNINRFNPAPENNVTHAHNKVNFNDTFSLFDVWLKSPIVIIKIVYT